MGYHAGALQGLHDRGIDVAQADVIVGTSAGSILGSYLAAGWAQTDFYEYAHGRHEKAVKSEADRQAEVDEIFKPLYNSHQERARRAVGSLFAVVSSRGKWPGGRKGGVPNGMLRKLFPSGLYSTERTRQRLHEDLPDEWPREGLFICTAELYSGELIAFGAKDAPTAPLPDAVLASTAIPGVFPPVRIGDKQYVDGGVVSATSLNLAVEEGCEAILCIAPLGYRTGGMVGYRDPMLWPTMFVRSMFARSLRREVNVARAKGVEVFVVRPWLSELKDQGTNSMRYYDREAVSDAARTGTQQLVDDNEDNAVLEAFASSPIGERKRAI